MGSQANVRSLEAIQHLRSAIVRFDDDVTSSLGSLRQELGRVLQWIDDECPGYWRQEARRCFDRIAEARTQLARKQLITVAGHRPECVEEKKALRTAKQDLEHAQEKLRLVRQWSMKTHRASDEYLCRVGRVEQTLSQKLPRIIAMLDRMLVALEAYVETRGSINGASLENED